MDKFTTYLAAIDGSADWATVGPLFDDAFDPDCVVITADGEYDRAGWAAMAKGLVDKGAIASGFEVTAQEGDTFVYRLTVTLDDDTLQMAARGTLHDGRLLRVEPVDPTIYSTLVERSR